MVLQVLQGLAFVAWQGSQWEVAEGVYSPPRAHSSQPTSASAHPTQLICFCHLASEPHSFLSRTNFLTSHLLLLLLLPFLGSPSLLFWRRLSEVVQELKVEEGRLA